MAHWKDLYAQIVTTDICCSCAACVVVCPHKVLDYDFAAEKPFQTDELRPGGCSHGETGCDLCARACPRLELESGLWQWQWPELEEFIFGRTRNPDEIYGIAQRVVLARSTDPEVLAAAQDGGVASALLLHGIETGKLDGGVVSGYDQATQNTQPKLVTTRDDVLSTGRSRYTYCATPMALIEAGEQRLKKLAMVGVSCEIASAPMLSFSGARKWGNRIKLTIGLMCSETFLPEPFLADKLQNEYGIDLSRVKKINIKGKVVVTYHDDTEVEIPLDECRPFARSWGCPTCSDFSAEYADISLGGLGMEGWSMVVIRSDRGMEWFAELEAAGKVEVRPAEEEQRALDLMSRLAKRQRRRGRNAERYISEGRRIPLNVIDTEKLVKRGSPEAAFRPDGHADASMLSEIAVAGASERGNP